MYFVKLPAVVNNKLSFNTLIQVAKNVSNFAGLVLSGHQSSVLSIYFRELKWLLLCFVDNVHFQNSAQLIEVMTQAGVKFEMQVNLYGI